MSDNPQTSETINEPVNEVIENNDSIPASDSGEQVQAESNEQVDEVAVAKQKANDAFNKQYGEKKQLERDLQLERERTAQFQQAERDRQAAQVGNIPSMPDAFDDDFDAKVKQRDEALIAQANHNAQNQAYQYQQQQTQQQAAQAKQQQVHDSMTSYSQKAVELGIKQDELQAAGNTVGGYGLSEDLIMHILGDSDGPLITKHLAANPQDGYQLASMSPYTVGSFLDGIKAKAGALKPKTSNAPSPATNLQGNGADPTSGKHKHIRGAKFE
tara:strand:- start:1 stop:813 length:813 start_codon:yes stop_codon:yes gene_type:complete